jgi:hypothetical protein
MSLARNTTMTQSSEPSAGSAGSDPAPVMPNKRPFVRQLVRSKLRFANLLPVADLQMPGKKRDKSPNAGGELPAGRPQRRQLASRKDVIV